MHHILSYSRIGSDKIGQAAPEKLKHYFNQTNVAGKRLMVLLDDLLDISKLESGKMSFEMQPNNVRLILNNTLSELEYNVSEKSLIVEVADSDGDMVVTCDAIRIEQVFRNLLENSIKYTPNGKAIEITLGHNPKTASGPGYLKISIADQGIGIPPDELESVFGSFTQSSVTNTGAGGTGLGLAICHEIIKGHGGKIWAGNRKEGGAVFCFILPQ